MKPTPTYLIILLLMLVALSCNQNSSEKDSADNADQQVADDQTQYHEREIAEGELWQEVEVNNFIQEAANVDKMQIKAAAIAKERAKHEAIRGYAGALSRDHENSLDTLKKIATQENLELINSMDVQYQKKLDELETVETDFDRYFLQMMVEAHTKHVEKYQNAMKNISQTHPVKSWLDEMVGVMQQHLHRGERLLDDASIIPPQD